MRTAGLFEQDTPQPDGQIFVGASEFVDITSAGAAVPTSSAAGLFTLDVTTASHAAKFFANLKEMLRTGVYASFANGYTAFGTTGPPPVPGPSAVANTSGPLATQGHPPITIANLPTIKGPVNGPLLKGLQINWVDVIYEVDTTALAAATMGLTKTKFPAAGTKAAPVVTNIIALAANGLPTATNTAGQATRTRVAVANPAMDVDDGSEIVLNVNLTLGASGTLHFYGAVVGVSFNFN